jgi:hypothetical protein
MRKKRRAFREIPSGVNVTGEPIFTIGHSTHSAEEFVALLRQHQVEAVADVRSSPFSRFNPQFNREPLEQFLKVNGIRYVFLGKELGARSEDRSCYLDGRVQYGRLAQTPLFQSGLDRVLQGAAKYRVALMCWYVRSRPERALRAVRLPGGRRDRFLSAAGPTVRGSCLALRCGQKGGAFGLLQRRLVSVAVFVFEL